MRTADRVIAQLDDFGATYFELSRLVRISPQTFRELGPAVSQHGVTHNGETIPICPQNTGRLAEAISSLRREPPATPAQNLRQIDRISRLLADAADLAADLHRRPLPDVQRAALAAFLQRGIDRLADLEARVLETVPEEVRQCAGL